MPFNLVQAGTNLYALNTDGGVSAALTLPTGIVLSATRIPRFARFKNYVIVVNTPSRPLSVGTDGVVRVLTPTPPSTAVTLSGVAGGTLSGTYLAWQTFVVLDADGNLIAESGYSAVSNTVTIAGKYLRAANVNLSSETISARRLYRTTSNGAVKFKWIDVDGNVATAVQDDKTDAGLGLIAGGALGSAPDLVLIAEWNGRLWGVGRTDGDNLRYTEAGQMYAWSALNTLPIPHVGDDRFGITALAPRRDVLGVGRRNRITQVAGNQTVNIKPIGVIESCGFLSQESVVTYRDIVFFLWLDGIYRWDASGVTCVSDDAGVRSWFTTNDYFNRGMFSQAFAIFDPVNTAYRLFLCSPGQRTTDRWVEYSLRTGKCYGPHQTLAFEPSCAIIVRGSNDQPYPTIGSKDGYLWQDVDERSDGAVFPIVLRIAMQGHDADNPDVEKYFGEVSVHTEPEAGGTMTVTTSVGDQADPYVNAPVPHDLTRPRERLDRIGTGKNAGLLFENAEINQNVTLYGYTIDPVFETGKR